MMKRKLYSLLALFSMMQVSAIGQTAGYHYQAKIDSIKKAAFYNIVITPEVSSHLKTDCSDLRIVNDSGKWVPHLLRTPLTEFTNDTLLSDLKIIKNENTGMATDLMIESLNAGTSNLLLELKNSLAERYGTVSGSDDMKEWFIINDSIVIKPINHPGKNNSNFAINFPPVNYKYYRIYIYNKGREPFNIIRVGRQDFVPLMYKSVNLHPPIENPLCIIAQKDSSYISYIRITQSGAYHFNKISVRINGVKYYSRSAELYIPSSAGHSFSNPGQLQQSFTISNNSTLEFNLPASNAKQFYLLIYNEDNLPLKIEQVKTFVDYRVATAWLEQGNHYSILMDNPAATAPKYDIERKDMQGIVDFTGPGIGEIRPLQQEDHSSLPLNNDKRMIWLIIGIAAVVLAFFTRKLVSDINKSKA